MPPPPLSIGFIGGAVASAVGYTHFNSSRLDGHFRVDCGCFSRDASKNIASATAYGVPEERTHASWENLLTRERHSIDAVVILTPTPDHAQIVLAAIESGIPVICEKALAVSSEDCRRIDEAVTAHNGFLAVTYNYSGYPMVRELRRMIAEGALGTLQQIHVEMPQEGFLRNNSAPQAWRLHDEAVPTVSLDLGVHVHHLVHFLTDGRQPVQLTGHQASYGKYDGIVDNVYCFADYEGDLRVQTWFGKTALGYRNGLRIRVFGSQAAAEWYQMDPENLLLCDADGQRRQIDRGAGEAEIAHLARYNRFKAGHPSGFIEAFANLYADIAAHLHCYRSGLPPPNAHVYGARESEQGLRFLEAIARSAASGKRQKI